MSNEVRLREVLQRYWGYTEFRPLQRPAMESVLAGGDSLVILPTGGGKSLCFQAPALLMEGVAVVISPLISLMKDQVDGLCELGVPAGKLHSGQSSAEAREVTTALREGRLKLLYVSPERAVLEGFAGISRGSRVSFLAIDEAHCISEWGHDFRPEYRQLRQFRDVFPDVGIHAYTATATPRVADDIERQLHLRQSRRLVGSFDRPNLFYRVDRRESAVDQIVEISARHPGESGIVYCISRKESEQTAAALKSRGIPALPYHAGLGDEERARNQEAFIRDEVRVVAATIAFGMGIDKPDVRFVVHHGMPKTLENYQQESGRAGRDGLPAECVMLFSTADIVKWRKIVSESAPEVRAATNEKLRQVEDYARTNRCRRAHLLAYFGETYPTTTCAGCDICCPPEPADDADGHEDDDDNATPGEPVADSLVVAQKILSCVKRLGESRGRGYTLRVLVGGRDERIRAAGHHELSTFGILGQHTRASIRHWIEELIHQDCLRRKWEQREAPLAITEKGWEVIRGRATPALTTVQERTAARKSRVEADSWSGVDAGLFEALRALRKRLADERALPPYLIFGDRTLREMARWRPTTAQGLRNLHGVGEAKVREYGDLFAGEILRYKQQHPGLQTNLGVGGSAAASPAARTNERERAEALLLAGEPPAVVANAVDRAPSTIEGYLAELVVARGITDPSPWVDRATASRIEAAADSINSALLKPVYDALDRAIPYWQIRVVLACRAARGRTRDEGREKREEN